MARTPVPLFARALRFLKTRQNAIAGTFTGATKPKTCVTIAGKLLARRPTSTQRTSPSIWSTINCSSMMNTWRTCSLAAATHASRATIPRTVAFSSTLILSGPRQWMMKVAKIKTASPSHSLALSNSCRTTLTSSWNMKARRREEICISTPITAMMGVTTGQAVPSLRNHPPPRPMGKATTATTLRRKRSTILSHSFSTIPT